jgi:hypothetical protein
MYTHMDSLALIIFVVPEKKAFEQNGGYGRT